MKNCSKCNLQFECGAEVGKCWCMEFTIKPEVLNELKEEFSNCLCPQCLREYDFDDYAMNCEEVEDGIYTYHCDDCGREYKSMHDGKFQGIGLCKNCNPKS